MSNKVAQSDLNADTVIAPVRLTIVCGLQGTGKTTVARILAEQRGAILLRTDEIRNAMLKQSQYTPKDKQEVYNAMFLQAQSLLQQGQEVILDATFSKQQNRLQAAEIARELNVKFEIIEVTCAEQEIKRRLASRVGDASEADWAVYLEAKKDFEPITETHITINTSGKLENLQTLMTDYS